MSDDSIDRWLGEYPYEQEKQEAERLQAQLNLLGQQLMAIRNRIEFYDTQKRMRQQLASFEAQVPPADPARPATLREQILRVIGSEPGRVWKLGDMRDKLVGLGWIAPDRAAAHRLQMMAGEMARKGQLDRPEPGSYRLLVSTTEPNSN